MGTLLYPSESFAKEVLSKYWVDHVYITQREFIRLLNEVYPDYEWSSMWTLRFLSSQNLPVIKDGGVIKYYSPYLYSTVDSVPLKVAMINVANNYIFGFTKKELKLRLKELNYKFLDDEFNKAFKSCSFFKQTGDYSNENHRIYRVEYSQDSEVDTGYKSLPISSMHPKYIEYIIRMKYQNKKLIECFDDKTEIYHLLKAFFNGQEQNS